MELVQIICEAAVEQRFYFKVIHVREIAYKMANCFFRRENVVVEDRKCVEIRSRMY